MKLVKPVLMVLAVLVVLILALAAVLPSDYRLVRTVDINRPVEHVYPLVVNLPNWPKWDPFTASDPDARSSFSDETGTVGSSWSWEGEVVGVGRLTLEDFVTNESIRSELEFVSPQPMVGKDIWEFSETPPGTKVAWVSEGYLDYPMGRLAGLFMESILGPSIESGLAKLKTVSEAMPLVPVESPSDGIETAGE